MYSITQDIENSEFNGWLNPQILLKNNRRQTGSRKRGYDLANIDLNEECDDIRRVLRPRHDREVDNSPNASRTRPIRSNRARQRPMERRNNPATSDVVNSEPASGPLATSTSAPEIGLPQSSSDLSLLQALAAYNWSQNYLLSHTDPLFLHRIQQATTYPSLGNVHMNQRIPQFDPWVLHNYLLAATYSAASTSHVSSDTATNDEAAAAAAATAAAMRMSQMTYPSLTTEMSRSNSSILWPYPLFLNQSANSVSNQPNTRPPHELHTHSTGSTHLDPNSDLSYYLRLIDYSQRDSVPAAAAAADGRLYQGIYPTDPRLSNYCSPIISNSCSYGSICPYHSGGHLLHSTTQSAAGHLAGSGPPPPTPEHISSSQSQNAFNSFPHSSTGVTFDQFWPQITPTMRPLNYSINGSNIDTLLHLAAHFEQRKRGITREELDKLPTHRYKASPEKQKQKDKNSIISDSKTNSSDGVLKCLVCLEDFESKQNIRVLRCDHEFHAKCIDKWLKINRTCPLCRADAFDGSAQRA